MIGQRLLPAARKAEPYLFYAVLLLSLLPVLLFRFFPTLDGPAHLYNSELIHEMLKGNELMKSMLRFNSEPVPNWSGHFILTLFNSFLPAWIAEKILLVFYLTALPLSFRQLVKAVSPGNEMLSFLVFPFTYNFLFFLGFYNFCLSIIFLLFALAYWVKHKERPGIRTCVVMLLLVLLTYFSHVFVFITLLLSLGVITAWQLALDLSKRREEAWKIFGRRTSILLLAALPAMAMGIFYFSSRTLLNEGTHLPVNELLNYIKNFRALIALNELAEQRYTRKMFYIVTALSFAVLFFRFYKREKKPLFNAADAFLWVSLVLLFLYFFLPDADGSGVGFVSIRMCLLFYIFLVLWIAMQKLPEWIILPAIALIVVLNMGKLKTYIGAVADLNHTAKELNSVAEHIPDNSIVYPWNFSGNWLQKHFSNYVGVDKPVVILEDYEATLNWFPLTWKKGEFSSVYLGKEKIRQPCVGWYGNVSDSLKPAEYVVTLQTLPLNSDTCNLEIAKLLKKYYKPVFTSERGQATLYHLEQ